MLAAPRSETPRPRTISRPRTPMLVPPRSETPRPRPPAKMRKQSSLSKLRISLSESDARPGARQVSTSSGGSISPTTSSPPPAYGATAYELETTRELGETLLGSPIPSTYKLMEFRRQRSQQEGEEGGLGGGVGGGEYDEWMNEKSKEELADLLVKAEDIIKERENELGLTSSVVKDLYENSVALQTKHEALLARLPPVSPSPNPSPDRVISRSSSFDYGGDDGDHNGRSPSPPPPPPLYRGHARRVSISTADISQLADQNAELMSKLEQLESESTSADHAGRRELRRLEKEITMLRQALEKTQAKSEELEEKTKGLDKGIDRVVEDAWKRKKEREQRMRAMRNARTPVEEEHTPIRDFAPRGSTFGGPSREYSMTRSLSRRPIQDLEEEDDDEGGFGQFNVMEPKPELAIMSQLLQKVQELEQTNSRILQQQAETVNQLQAVQRDTEQISKVYECLADPQEVELERAAEGNYLSSSTNSAKFGSFKRRMESDRRQTHGGKARRSVVGLFEDPQHDPAAVPFNSWWNDGRHRTSYSMGSSAGFASPTLNFTSPHDDFLAELSPIGSRLSLEGELQGGSTTWESEQQKSSWHLRSQSLSNISQISMPSSPLVASSGDTKTPIAADFPRSAVDVAIAPRTPPPRTPPQTMPGTLPLGFGQPNLKVEPPTPAKNRVLHQQSSFDVDHPPHSHVTKSPRHEFISQRIRARKSKWEDERFGSLSSATSNNWGGSPAADREGYQPVFLPPSQLSSANSSRSATPALLAPRPRSMRISTIVDTLVDQFDGNLSVTRSGGVSPVSDYEDAAEEYVSESYDEGEEEEEGEEETGDEYGDEEDGELYDDEEETMVNQTPQFSEGNALQLHQNSEGSSTKDWAPSSRAKEGGVVSHMGVKNGVASTSKNNNGSKWGSVVLEVWLWLQFGIIIFVFLCAMAKRGPKAVLADAEHRTRTRKESMHLRRK